jgi:hypothetical protein
VDEFTFNRNSKVASIKKNINCSLTTILNSKNDTLKEEMNDNYKKFSYDYNNTKIAETDFPQTFYFDKENNLHTITEEILRIPLIRFPFLIRYVDTKLTKDNRLICQTPFTLKNIVTATDYLCKAAILGITCYKIFKNN